MTKHSITAALLLLLLLLLATTLPLPVTAESPRLRSSDCTEDGCLVDPHAGEWFELEAKKQTGCIHVKKAVARAERNLILGECGSDPENAWRYNNGMFHSKLDDNMCIQAGRKETVSRGRKMRLFPCDELNDNQKFYHFESSGHIKLQSNQDLCIEFEGRNANINSDVIVLKTCIDAVDGWIKTKLSSSG